MTVALETVLAKTGLRVTADRFLTLVEEAAQQLSDPQPNPTARLPEETRTALRAAGLRLDPLSSEEDDPRARTVAELAVLRDTALSVNEVAARLRIDGSRVRHRISARHLIGWKDRGGWKLPAWQFTDTDVLPGLVTVLAAVPDDQPDLVVAKFMTTPQSDLELAEQPVTPRDWLLAGGSPGRVAGLAAGLGTPS